MITSTNNSRIKHIVQLQKKRKLRDEEGVFVVEGIRMFQEVPVESIVEIMVTESFYNDHISVFKELEHRYTNLSQNNRGLKDKLDIVTDDVFIKISETKTPQGVLCVVKRSTTTLEEMLKEEDKLLMVLENVQDPGNVGTIIRTGEAAGVTGFILTKDCADIYQGKTIRSTMGAIFRKKCVYVDDIEETLKQLAQYNVETYAAHLHGKCWHNEVKYSQDIAFLVGNEGNGLSEVASAMADTKVKIPMAGEVESLNVAIAATILMYEVFMQRR